MCITCGDYHPPQWPQSLVHRSSPHPGNQTRGQLPCLTPHLYPTGCGPQWAFNTVWVFDSLTASLVKPSVLQDLEVQNLSSVLYFAKGKDRLVTNIWTNVVTIGDCRKNTVEHCTGSQETLHSGLFHPHLLSIQGRNLCAFICLAIKWGESYLLPLRLIKVRCIWENGLNVSLFSSLTKQC